MINFEAFKIEINNLLNEEKISDVLEKVIRFTSHHNQSNLNEEALNMKSDYFDLINSNTLKTSNVYKGNLGKIIDKIKNLLIRIESDLKIRNLLQTKDETKEDTKARDSSSENSNDKSIEELGVMNNKWAFSHYWIKYVLKYPKLSIAWPFIIGLAFAICFLKFFPTSILKYFMTGKPAYKVYSHLHISDTIIFYDTIKVYDTITKENKNKTVPDFSNPKLSFNSTIGSNEYSKEDSITNLYVNLTESIRLKIKQRIRYWVTHQYENKRQQNLASELDTSMFKYFLNIPSFKVGDKNIWNRKCLDSLISMEKKL